MHLKALSIAALLALAPSVSAQSLLSRATAQHASVATSVSVATAAPGAKVTLWADVSPFPAIHIYAAGAKEFTPVSVVMTPNPAIRPGKPVYPKPDASAGGGADAPAYSQRFRIAVPVTIAPTSPKGSLAIAGAVNYQACDDRLCYPVSSAPVSWTVQIQ